MRPNQILLSLVRPTIFCLIFASSSVVFGQSSAFTYQGRLNDGGTPANGNYDLEFRLFDVQSGGAALATQQQPNVAVLAGVFTVTLDFGSNFTGGQRFLEIGVRPAGGSSFTPLSPRQAITSTPYAIRSLNAGVADTATNANQLGGVAASSYLKTVARDASLVGNGTGGSPLSIAVPLQLTGNLNGRIISGTNTSTQGSGVYGFTNDSTDASGGVTGEAPNGDGIVGIGGRAGVFGRSTTGVGVNGLSVSSAFAGVLGFNGSTGPGLRGISDNGRAIWASSANGFAGYFEGKSYFAGNVGIGTTTPAAQLHAVDASTTGTAIRGTSGTGFGVSGLSTSGTGVYGSSSGYGVHGESVSGVGVVGFSSTGTALLGTSTSGFAALFVGRVNVDGNLGIGTPVPSAPLDVKPSGGQHVFLGGGDQTGSELKLTNSGTAHFSIYNSGNNNLTFANTSENILANSAGSPLMSITSDGRVGIGTTGPGFRLHVAGETRTNTLSIDSYGTGTSGFTLCANSSNNRVGLCPASSVRYKTNIVNLKSGLSTISRLRPVTFDWMENATSDLGLIAEEVAEVDPHLALYMAGKVEGVKYDRIGVVLINAVKEQQTLIQKQQEQLVEQQKEIAALIDLLCRSHRRARICK